MKLPIAKEGYVFIFPLLVASIALYILGSKTASLIFLLFFLAVTYFFRDPERKIVNLANTILSPADGKVIKVERVYEGNYLGGESIQITIFLSLFDVHINRSPISGVVKLIKRIPGGFLPAFHREAPLRNEQNLVGIADGRIRILIRQVAGLFARRIVCWCQLEEAVDKGERIGLIRLGSRVDVYLPKEVIVLVKEGERVKGGMTILGVIR